MAQWVADTPNHDHVAMPSTTMAMAFLAAVIRGDALGNGGA